MGELGGEGWGGGVWEEVLQGRGEEVVVRVVRLVVWTLVRSTWLYSGGRVRFRLEVVGGGLESEVEGRLKEVWMSSCRNACGRKGCCWGWGEVGAVGSGGVSGDPGACSWGSKRAGVRGAPPA